MAHDAQFLCQVKIAKPASLRGRAAWVREAAACAFSSAQLTAEAYWTRLRKGHSPLSATLATRSQRLPKASLAGRPLSAEPWLRPTRSCDCHAPEVIALAEEFRARSSSDWEYASAIFDFASNQIDFCFDLPPRRGVVGTLQRRCGTCHEKLNVLVALARAGGIPSRYCTIGIAPGHLGVQALTHDDAGVFGILTQVPKRFIADAGGDPRAKRILSLFVSRFAQLRSALKDRVAEGTLDPGRTRSTHHLAELQIGGVWIAADPTNSDADCAAANLPLQRLGYEPIVLSKALGMIVTGRSEAIPVRRRVYLRWSVKVLMARGLFDHFNAFAQKERARGRQILAEVGVEAFMRRRAHLYRRVPAVASAAAIPLPPCPRS